MASSGGSDGSSRNLGSSRDVRRSRRERDTRKGERAQRGSATSPNSGKSGSQMGGGKPGGGLRRRIRRIVSNYLPSLCPRSPLGPSATTAEAEGVQHPPTVIRVEQQAGAEMGGGGTPLARLATATWAAKVAKAAKAERQAAARRGRTASLKRTFQRGRGRGVSVG